MRTIMDENQSIISENIDDEIDKTELTFFNETSDNDSGWDTDLEADEYKEIIHSYEANSKDKYIAACKSCGVTPASYFVRNMKNVRLNMPHHGLGVKGIKAICVSLMTNTHLTALDLRDNALGDEGVSYICEMLLDNIFINELELSENNIGIAGIKSICDLLQQIDHVKRLSLSKNNLDAKCVMLLSQMLEKNTSLRYLDISHNAFGEEAGLHIGHAIAMNEYLEELDISWNHIRQKGACAIAKSLQENITLKRLNLSWNGFGDDGIYVLACSLKINSSLQQLDVNSNRISHVGAEHLQKALQMNEGLTVLKISQNPLQQGSVNLLKGIKSNENSTLLELDLSGTQVNQQFMEILQQLSVTHPVLNIYHGGLGGSPQKASERPKPMKVLRDYIKNNQMRVFDFFKTLDKDKSMSISIPEFVKGLKEAGVPLRVDELSSLVSSLDIDGDGEIDYKEFLIGHQEIQKAERQEVLKDKADKERKKNLSKNLKPSTPNSKTRQSKALTRLQSPRPESAQPDSSRYTDLSTPTEMISSARRKSKSFTEGFFQQIQVD